MGDNMMKAVNYQGAFKVKVEDVPKPKIEHPDDIIVKVTTAGMLLPFCVRVGRLSGGCGYGGVVFGSGTCQVEESDGLRRRSGL